MILTTEKDAMRLEKYAHEIDGMPFYVLPIEHKFLFNEGEKFMKRIIEFIENFKKPV
jgi:tetraacyldisaccharide 4'-kinase